MTRRTDIPEEIYGDELVRFLAGRYHTTPRKILCRFLEQRDAREAECDAAGFRLEENEMAMLRDLTAVLWDIDSPAIKEKS